MSLKSRVAWWLYRDIKAGGTPNIAFLPPWVLQTFIFPSFEQIIAEGYQKNSAVFALVSALAFAFPEPKLMAYKTSPDGQQVAERNHPILDLVRHPNPSMGEQLFEKFAIVYASLGGNAYLWKQRNGMGKTIALWPFSDGCVVPVPGHTTDEGLVKEYWYYPGGYGGYGPRAVIPASEIIQWMWAVNPSQPARGIGAIMGASREVDMDSEAGKYVYALLKNDAVPRTVITLTEGEELTPAKASRLRKEWETRLGGTNRGGPAFLEAGMTAARLGLNLNELAFESLVAVDEARLSAAFRTPAIIAGLNVGLTHPYASNYGEARKHWTEQTLVPLWESFANAIQGGLADEYPDVSLAFDLSLVKALQENENLKWQRYQAALDGGGITRGEFRSALGFPVEDSDDVMKETLAMTWVPRGEVRPPAAPPAPGKDQAAQEQAAGDQASEDQNPDQAAP